MPLIEQLKHAVESEESMFRAQLMREDITRLEKLRELSGTCGTEAEFLKQGAYIGWTQSDMHTHKIKDALNEFLIQFYAFETGDKDEKAQADLDKAWADFSAARLEKLVRCL